MCVACYVTAGVTQEMIDNLRLSRENLMLRDLQEAAQTGCDLECRARHGETPVRTERSARALHCSLTNNSQLTRINEHFGN